ncbi:hypothetical protein [Daejeonella sp.]|uniref:hypothetical protein n=1 Tax=Daejeonella sp. TaxID=2805397 RepID=UPI0030C4ED0D
MTFKTIFIILISVLVTVILMNNTDEMEFWIFGDARIPKLVILGSMFGLGLIVGFVLGRPKKKVIEDVPESEDVKKIPLEVSKANLSDEDREYLRE